MQYHSSTGFRAAIVGIGIGRLSVLVMSGQGLVLEHRPLTEARHMTPLTYKGKPYPLSRAHRLFKQFAKHRGATKGAGKLLKKINAVTLAQP